MVISLEKNENETEILDFMINVHNIKICFEFNKYDIIKNYNNILIEIIITFIKTWKLFLEDKTLFDHVLLNSNDFIESYHLLNDKLISLKDKNMYDTHNKILFELIAFNINLIPCDKFELIL